MKNLKFLLPLTPILKFWQMFFRRYIIFVVLFVSAIILLDGCKNEKTCTEYMQPYVNVGLHFYKVFKKGSRVYIEDSTLTSINIETEKYIFAAKNSSTISLPLSQLDDSCLFIVRINSLPSDEVYFKYKRNRIFINYECGFRTDFKLDTIVSLENKFDSVQIVQPEVSINEKDHIKIYFYRPDYSSN